MHGSQPPRRMRYSVESRLRVVGLIEAGVAPGVAAAAAGASRASAYRWWRRYRAAGWQALCDRPPVPVRQPRRLSAADEQEILAARRYANAGPVIVGGLLGRPSSTVWKCFVAMAARGLRAARPSRLVAMSGRGLVSYCMSTLSGWAASTHRASGCLAMGCLATAMPAGSTCTSPSTTTHGSPTPKSCPARAPRTVPAS